MQDKIKEHYTNWILITERCKKDEEYKRVVKELIKRNPVFFFENFLFTYDPRKEIKNLPFKPYEFQKKLILKIDDNYRRKKHLLVEKSRDMGFSWIVLGYFVWKTITENGFSAGVGSRKSLLVDELGNMKSLLERVRFMIRLLPPFLREGYDESKNSKSGLIHFPPTGAYISGEGGDDIGRGDRTSIYLIDEFAHIPRSSMVQAAISQTSDCIIYGSTPKGKGNEFARLRWKTDIDVFVMDWKDHPNKTQEWYDQQKAYLDEATLAQEIDRSYAKSMEGRVYKWFDAEKHAKDEILVNKNYPLIVSCDWGIGDPTAAVFLQYYGGTVHIIANLERKDMEIGSIFKVIAEELLKWGCTFNDVCGWYGDPDGRNRNIITGESIAQYIKTKYNITLRFKLPNIPKMRILSVRMLGEHGRILVSKTCHHLIECFENYRYPEKESGDNEKPLHDWTSHSMSALEYYTIYEHGMDQYENKNRNLTTTRFR